MADSRQKQAFVLRQITAPTRELYRQIFSIADKDGDGVVGAQEGFEFLLSSSLQRDLLAQIWSLGDIDNSGSLDFAGFCIVCRFVALSQSGLPLNFAGEAPLPFFSLVSLPISPSHPEFDSLFAQADQEKNGVIQGNEALSFFTNFGLPVDVLGEIWGRVDHSGRGVLDRPQFDRCMRIIALVQCGHDMGHEHLVTRIPSFSTSVNQSGDGAPQHHHQQQQQLQQHQHQQQRQQQHQPQPHQQQQQHQPQQHQQQRQPQQQQTPHHSLPQQPQQQQNQSQQQHHHPTQQRTQPNTQPPLRHHNTHAQTASQPSQPLAPPNTHTPGTHNPPPHTLSHALAPTNAQAQASPQSTQREHEQRERALADENLKKIMGMKNRAVPQEKVFRYDKFQNLLKDPWLFKRNSRAKSTQPPAVHAGKQRLSGPPQQAISEQALILWDSGSRYYGYISRDGTCFSAVGTVVGYLNAESGDAGNADLEYIGHITADVSAESCVLEDVGDRLVATLDLGRALIRNPLGTTLVEISSSGELKGADLSTLGRVEGFSYHDLRVLALFLIIVDQSLVKRR